MVSGWLGNHGNSPPPNVLDRPLRGALYATPDAGFIFLDGSDPGDERRFSFAHEVAHFLLEYVEPRRRAALRLGPHALDALDGHRPASAEDRIDAALAGVDLEPQLHLLDRSPGLLPATRAAAQAEARADQLAVELLAPVGLVQRLRPARAGIAELAGWLREQFGLPGVVATAYARQLAPPERVPLTDVLSPVGQPEHSAPRDVSLSNFPPRQRNTE